MRNKRIIRTLLLLSILFIMVSQTVYADAGPKPTLTIHVKNYKNKSYYLDVLTKGDRLKYSDYAQHSDDPENIKDMPLYKYNEDGWLATHVREKLLYANLKGKFNKKTGYMVHEFSYQQVPKTFKVIVQYENGEIVVSNEITTNKLWADVSFDLKTGKVTEIPHVSYNFLHFIFLIVLTTVVEIIIAALFFKIKEYKLIIKVNIATQLLLHLVLILTFSQLNSILWYTEFYLLEFYIVFIEFYVYKLSLNKYNIKKLLLYSVVANIITFAISQII